VGAKLDIPGDPPVLNNGGSAGKKIVPVEIPLAQDQFWHFQPEPPQEQSQGLHNVIDADLLTL